MPNFSRMIRVAEQPKREGSHGSAHDSARNSREEQSRPASGSIGGEQSTAPKLVKTEVEVEKKRPQPLPIFRDPWREEDEVVWSQISKRVSSISDASLLNRFPLPPSPAFASFDAAAASDGSDGGKPLTPGARLLFCDLPDWDETTMKQRRGTEQSAHAPSTETPGPRRKTEPFNYSRPIAGSVAPDDNP